MIARYHFGFMIEQTLGHITHGMNLQQYAASDSSIQAEWGLPRWETGRRAAKIPLYRSNWTLQAGLSTRQILKDISRRTGLDVLFFHTQVTAVLSPDWLRRIPSIVSLDATPRQYDSLGMFYNHPTGPIWVEELKWRLNRNCFRLARHIVTWSEWARQGLMDEYQVPADKISVIPPGVDTLAWTPPAPKRIDPGPVRILFVGGDLERKGGRLLLEAFRRLRVQEPAISGSGALPVELHLVTRTPVDKEPGLFVYTDMEPNSQRLKDLFFHCDIFCLPTLGDCLPMALSEAGAAGLPAVSTRLAAIPEIIHDGETGFLTPPGDVEALTAALQRLVQDPTLRHQQGRAAGQVVREKYDAGCNAARLINLMKQIGDESGGERTDL